MKYCMADRSIIRVIKTYWRAVKLRKKSWDQVRCSGYLPPTDILKVADFNYVNRKTKKLLDFGSDKIIWIFTRSQQVMIAEKSADAWLTMNRDGGPVEP